MSGSAAVTASSGFVRIPNRGLITACTMAATVMQALDSTIANVALPYMQGSLSASYDEITWVLTSYVTAAAIMTAPVGWLSTRFGRKNLYLICVIGFTIASMLCGAAQSLGQIVMFRVLQGVFGAALVPLSQSTMLDIYSVEERGSAMALWGVGVMLGPILGPTLGGYLTELYNWRWVFYVNLPVGILATIGLYLFMPNGKPQVSLRFDWIGFAVLSMGIGSLQMMLDRGQNQDWFSSPEIIVEAVLAGLGFYLFLVHLLTARNPFIRTAVFRDRNLVAGLLLMFAVGSVLLASSALLAPWLQSLSNYPVETTGFLLAPRGIGTMAAMLLGGRLSGRYDPRLIMLVGLVILLYSLWVMTQWTPDVSSWDVMVGILVQGFGLGFVFVPLQVLSFWTLPPSLRTDGTSLLSLFRNVGSAIGISVMSATLAHNTQALHSEIGAQITPFNRALQVGGAVGGYWITKPTPGAPVTPQQGLAMLDGMVKRQAEIIAYLDDFKLMMLSTAPAILLLLLLRRPRIGQAAPPPQDSHAVMD